MSAGCLGQPKQEGQSSGKDRGSLGHDEQASLGDALHSAVQCLSMTKGLWQRKRREVFGRNKNYGFKNQENEWSEL